MCERRTFHGRTFRRKLLLVSSLFTLNMIRGHLIIIALLHLIHLVIAQTSLVVNGTVLNFASAARVSNSFTLLFGVSAIVSHNGWAALGFNEAGVMFPSRSIIARRISGVDTVTELNITSEHGRDIVNATRPVITNAKLSYSSDGTIVNFIFTIPVVSEPVIKMDGNQTVLIYAVGPEQTTPGRIPKHTDNGAYDITLKPKAAVNIGFWTAFGQYVNTFQNQFLVLHVLCMTIAWMILAPIGSFLASPSFRRKLFPSDKKSNPRHTNAHVIVLAVTVALSIVGTCIGFVLLSNDTFTVHVGIGIIVLIMMIFQVFLGIWRKSAVPGASGGSKFAKAAKKYKHMLTYMHAMNGRLMWAVAMINLFLGLIIYGDFGLAAIATAMAFTVAGIALLFTGPTYGFIEASAVPVTKEDFGVITKEKSCDK